MRISASMVLFAYCFSAMSALAQTSTSITRDNIKASYSTIKDTYRRTEVKGDPAAIRRMKEIELSDCVSADAYVSGRSKTTVALAELAKDVTNAIFILENTAYPESIWRDYVNRHEQSQLEAISRDAVSYARKNISDVFQEQLARRLKKHKSQSRVNLPDILYEACGGHGIEITIRTDPPGAKVFQISRWMKEYCRAIGVDSDDEQKCEEWQPTEVGQVALIYGDRTYKARWPTNVGFRVLLFNQIKEGATVVIRPSR